MAPQVYVTAFQDHAMSPKVPPPLVLLADDFQDALELYSEYLGSHGFRVVTAVNGFEAVEAARRLQPAVIVMETWMPVLSGLAAAQVLRGDPKLAQVPMLALTASVMPPQRAAALDAGFNEVIAKPCLPDALEAAVRHALRSAGGYGVRPDSAGVWSDVSAGTAAWSSAIGAPDAGLASSHT